MGQIFSHDQLDVLEQMAALSGASDAESIIAEVQALADAGNDKAGNLIAQWKFWQRYESLLARGRHDAAQAVSLMIYDAGKAISKMEVRA